MKKLGIDLGYHGVKAYYDGKLYKLPTAISFHNETGIGYGEETHIEFEGNLLHVGEAAVTDDSFTTTDYKFKYKYDPVIIYHIIKQLGILKEALAGELHLFVGLALIDWKFKDEYIERIQNIDIEGNKIGFQGVSIIPQGAGAFIHFMNTMSNEVEKPDTVSIIDIGYNTINFLYFENGKVNGPLCKSFPGHGVSGIVRKMTNFIEGQYGTKFSEQQVNKIFIKGKFTWNGVDQPAVAQEILTFKQQFIMQLFGSILTSERKILATSDKVLLTGGGCYLLENIPDLPQNYTFVPGKNYEFNNVRGYVNE